MSAENSGVTCFEMFRVLFAPLMIWRFAVLSWDALELVPSLLGLISEQVVALDGSVRDKHRLIIDCKASVVNSLVLQTQHILLLSIEDSVRDSLTLLAQCSDGKEIKWLLLDIAAAFYQVLHWPCERPPLFIWRVVVIIATTYICD
eukprot:6478345-Amphidinium_carterae.2